jgi:NitT/TauT family transport system ATP-binding protein
MVGRKPGNVGRVCENLTVVSEAIARRLDVTAEIAARALSGNLKVAADGTTRATDRYLMIGRKGAARPDPVQAAWIYAQIVRWGQASLSEESLALAQAVFRPDIYDGAVGGKPPVWPDEPADGIGGFAGDPFDLTDIAGHLASWRQRKPGKPKLSVVR